MKSAESSGGLAPLTCATHSGALSMIAGMTLLRQDAPALSAHGPLHGSADDHEHDGQRDQETEHQPPSFSSLGAWPLDICDTDSVATSVPSGSTICSFTTPISGYTRVPYSTMSRPSSSTEAGTRRTLSLRRIHADTQPDRKPSGRNVAMPMSWPPINNSTLLIPVGYPAAKTPTH